MHISALKDYWLTGLGEYEQLMMHINVFLMEAGQDPAVESLR